jgi:hypothetical protein
LGQGITGGGSAGAASAAGSTSTTGGMAPMTTAGNGNTTGGMTPMTTAGNGNVTAGSMNGGSGGSDTGGGMNGGSGGTGPDPQVEIDAAVAALKGWRFESPCVAFNPGCNSNDICWEDSVNSSKAFKHAKQIQIAGDPAHQYDVTLRARGVIEARDYPSDCQFLTGGNSQDGNTASIIENCDGYANAGQVTFNIWELKIAEPAHVFYMNAVKTHPNHRVDDLDQTFTIRVKGGTKIDFSYDDLNGGQIRNCSHTVEGVAPYPNVYDGQFFQLDVVDAKLVP